LIAYAHYLIDNGDTATVKDSIWPLVKRDVGYVTDTWNQTGKLTISLTSWAVPGANIQPGFDLWEEVNGTSFFTLVAQHRSLIEGSAMASTVEDECPGCDTEAPKIRCLLKDMWNSGEGYMMADINNDQGRSNKGTNTFLASIHS
jgi:glucoamylase